MDKKVLNCMILGKIEYLIKWKGYAELENTWEPAENLQCFGMIAEFEERYKSEPTFYHSKYKKSSAKVKQNLLRNNYVIFFTGRGWI